MKIKKIIKALIPPFLWYFFSILLEKIMNNKNQNKIINDTINKDAIQLFRKSFGEKNPDKQFYVITGFKAGMFSTLQYVIAHIRRADLMGMIPVVDFENFSTAYTSANPVNNELNTWLWFFNQVSPYSLKDVYQSKNVYFGSGEYNWDMGHYFSGHNFLDYYFKYIHLQNNIIELIEKYKKELDFNNNKILGIQFRGWEQNTTSSHPFGPTIKQMFRYNDEILKKYDIDKIYLATEQQEYHDAFIKKYGEKVIFTPYFMTKKGVNAYKIQPEPREHHLYHCGVEIIINAFLLSECIGLLHCGTNVSTFAKFINNGKYEFEYFIFNGVNSNNPYLAKFMYNIRKILPKKFGGLEDKVTIHEKND